MERVFCVRMRGRVGSVLVYLVRNLVNGKVYVGKTTQDLAKRWGRHKSSARHGSPYPFHVAIREYGEKAFSVEELGRADSLEELTNLEIHYIATFKSNLPAVGYNVVLIEFGEWNRTNPRFLGAKHSDEWKAERRAGTREYWARLTPAELEARSARMRGRRPEASRQRMKEAVFTDGRLERMIAARRAQEARWRAEKEAYELAHPKPPVSDEYRTSQSDKTRASWASMTIEDKAARKKAIAAGRLKAKARRQEVSRGE
jgi:group I intron endonuclease